MTSIYIYIYIYIYIDFYTKMAKSAGAVEYTAKG